MKSYNFLKLFEDGFPLMVSIPRNDPRMALAAFEGGADAIKVHLNVEHFASGTGFGSWHEEKGNIQKIMESVDIPVGILPGFEKTASKEEIMEARDMGISFLDAFAHSMPVHLWCISGLKRMLAVNTAYSPDQVRVLDELGVDVIEATLLSHEEYGKPLNIRDLTLYHNLSLWTRNPVVVPTQKKIEPEETAILKNAGVAGIVIGAVVTGRDTDGVQKTTKAFRDAIDKMQKS